MKINNFDYFNKSQEVANKAKPDDFDIDIKFASKGGDSIDRAAGGLTRWPMCNTLTIRLCLTQRCA